MVNKRLSYSNGHDLRHTNTEVYQWRRIYTQKNMYSIISVKCLLDLMPLPYFEIF